MRLFASSVVRGCVIVVARLRIWREAEGREGEWEERAGGSGIRS